LSECSNTVCRICSDTGCNLINVIVCGMTGYL
jgi:hypothetical protein